MLDKEEIVYSFLENASDINKRDNNAQLISFVFKAKPSQAKHSLGSCLF